MVGGKNGIMDLERLQQNAGRASELLQAMSNPHRLLILCHLSNGEKCVSALEKEIGLSQSALSQHLALLRKEKLVDTRRKSQSVFYSLSGKEAITIIDTLYGIYCPKDDATDSASKLPTKAP
jgi:ArsR family transcriptional regulator, virulence genes transcriptional regulator